ncbi:unnamed protein product [Urochloa humidicola]
MAPPPGIVEVRCTSCSETPKVVPGLNEFACPDCGTPQALPPELMSRRPRRALPLPGRCAPLSAAISVVAPPAAVPITPSRPAQPSEVWPWLSSQLTHVGQVQKPIHSEQTLGHHRRHSFREEPFTSSRVDTGTEIPVVGRVQNEPANHLSHRQESHTEPLNETISRPSKKKSRFVAGSDSYPSRKLHEEHPNQARVILEVLRRTILPRSGYREAITALQQWTLAYILEKKEFDLVDFLMCEIEDAIADGLRSNWRLPYAHYLSYLFCRSGSEMGPLYNKLRSSRDIFPLYRAAKSNDERRGHRSTTAAHETWTHEQRQQAEVEDTELRAGEVHAGLEGFLDVDLTSDSSHEDFISIPSVRMAHDHEAEGSGSQFDTPTEQIPQPATPTPAAQGAAQGAAQPAPSPDIAALASSVRELTQAVLALSEGQQRLLEGQQSHFQRVHS